MSTASLLGIDLSTTPFSRRGSYFALSRVTDQHDHGVYLRTVRGDARHREIVRLLLDGGTEAQSRTTAGMLTLQHGTTRVEAVLDGPGRAYLTVHGGALTLDFRATSQYDVVLRENQDTWRFIDSGANRNYRVRVLGGTTRFDARWDGVRNTEARLRIAAREGTATVVVDEYGSAVPTGPLDRPDTLATLAQADFDAWCSTHGGDERDDPGIGDTVRLAAFVTWAAIVPPGGALRRESMLMSKNRMTNVWSWDHCFNAMALWRDPQAAADQLFAVFDHQDEHGCLPDYVNDAGVERNFVKPPIHGWSINRLIDLGGLTDDAIAALYEPLRRWTEWWFAHRVYGDDGIPSHNHGNDSGWDNATTFGADVPVQSPDLLAFLVRQMQTLARIARRLGRHDDATAWATRADNTVRTLCEAFWAGDRFVARDTLTGGTIDSQSLLTFMPLVLGELLPPDVSDTTVQRLLDGGYLTPHGPATEPPTSPHYESDGYWRGPIWAPSTMLLADGLRRSGRPELAEDIESRFMTTCAGAGMAENFDAMTGAGLRDRSMTWTASVYLSMVTERAEKRSLVDDTLCERAS
ncbi:trehalase family glycosidase [Streptomyces sp. NBC_01239]|uniref:amylo-alpha-1,6-glucosidase n=1 Tax=Streptomyces sp. NBC_01239 TaxID=2903792 RepID=UPI00224E8DAC|nr:trehalase family glycosidase [Streptomyces sp. NBC_01239]MCX4818009.1 trehalase family glycosidase [Streptomyces sp. NBC_01239]